MSFKFIRKKSKSISSLLILLFVSTIIPTNTFAITSGPTQEEYATFQSATSSGMVSHYTGDFTYNIPLLNVPGPDGGYPINLFYDGNNSVDAAGSWVGLGWNLNIGSIQRQLRGLPDDFNGEEVKQEMHIKDHFGFSLDIPTRTHREFAGLQTSANPRFNTQLYYNNFKGLGYRISTSLGVPLGSFGTAGVGLSFDSQNGIGIDPNISLSERFGRLDVEIGLNASYNSRRGLQDIALNTTFKTASESYFKSGFKTETETSFQAGANSIGSRMVISDMFSVSGKKAGFGGTSTMSFGLNQTTPTVTLPTKTTSINFDLKFGKARFLTFTAKPYGLWHGNLEFTKLKDGGVSRRQAFGYLHTEKDPERRGLLDFNRSEMPYSKKLPNLAPSSYSYDPLFVSGAGIQGMFRPHRAKVEVLSTAENISRTDGHRVNLELGYGATPPSTHLHISAGYTNTTGENYSGIWRDHGDGPDNLDIAEEIFDPFSNNGNTEDSDYEPVFYRLFGEQHVDLSSQGSQLSSWDEADPLRVKLKKRILPGKPFTVETSGNNLINEKNPGTGFNAATKNTSEPTYAAVKKRKKRANAIEMLNAKEAANYGMSKDLQIYNLDGNRIDKFPVGQTVPDNDQISEIDVLKPNGLRYVYGLPAKNTKQVDAIFNVFLDNVGANTDVVAASTHTTDSRSNQYMSKTTLPEYAHNWLLTHVLSSDYADRTGDGLTSDDPGSWMKFEYTKTTADGKYKWREPYEDANFIEGNKSSKVDDMASYVYGEKDMYYLNRIETATHVATFDISPRHDARSVVNEANGRQSTSSSPANKMFQLDKINLYAKKKFSVNADQDGLTLLKTVHLKFAQSDGAGIEELCYGIPSAPVNRGKLTLEEVYITSDQSVKGSLSPYQFRYSDNNPRYNRRNKDKWGNYQENLIFDPNTGGGGSFNSVYGDTYPYIDFPYTDQSQYTEPGSSGPPKGDQWHLKEITLPTGGVISVELESDDYAYDMNKPAAQMFDIIGLGTYGGTVKDRYEDGNYSENILEEDANGNYKVFVKLTTPISDAIANKDEYFRKHYLAGIDNLYFKVFTQLKSSVLVESERDYVTGYCELSRGEGDFGVLPDTDGNYNIGFITLNNRRIQDNNHFGETIHPFQRAGLEHLQANRPELIYGYNMEEAGPNNVVGTVTNIIGSIGTFFTEIATMAIGFNRNGRNQNWCENIFLNGKSIVRLNNGTGFMYGGGKRVKKIELRNNWTTGIGEDTYGQEYDYTTEENGRVISSGVAVTPFSAGGDESGLLEPVVYPTSTLLKSPSQLFVEKPIMKQYYPGPSVGYSKVTVKSIAPAIHSDQIIEKSLAPVSVYEYYTHKDFPVIESQTDLSSQSPVNQMIPLPFLGSILKKHIGRSQGYTVELNNMAGVMKASASYTAPTSFNPEPSLISKTEYIYNTEDEYNPNAINKLSGNVKIAELDVNGEVVLVDGRIGESVDIFHDFHENYSSIKQTGGDLNFDFFYITFPAMGFTLMPAATVNRTQTSLRTAVTNKVVYRTAVLKEVKVTEATATITTENIAFDKITAAPLLTRTSNEFKDPYYSFTKPAHLVYQDKQVGTMAGAYQNIGVEVANTTANNGIVNLAAADFNLFCRGDEVWVQDESDDDDIGHKAFVLQLNPSNNQITLIDEGGSFDNWSEKNITIIRSGHRNLFQTTASSTVFRGETVIDPLTDIVDEEQSIVESLDEKNNNVINTSASGFANEWATRSCNNYYEFEDGGGSCTEEPILAELNNLFNDVASINDGTGIVYSNPRLNLSELQNSPLTPAIETIVRNGLSSDIDIMFSSVVQGNTLSVFISPNTDVPGCNLFLQSNNGNPVPWDLLTSFSNPMAIGEFEFTTTATSSNGGTFDIKVSQPSAPGCFQVCSGGSNTPGYVLEDCGDVPEDDIATGDFNPFLEGVLGNWRPAKTYVYKTPREYNQLGDLRNYGVFETYTPFNDWADTNPDDEEWITAITVNKYTAHGNILEEEDAIGNPSAAQFGYEKRIAVATGSNAGAQEIGFDNFEDYPKNCTDHLRFKFNPSTRLSEDYAHSGKRSVKVEHGDNYPSFTIKLDKQPIDADGCIGAFKPALGETYVLSAWTSDVHPTLGTKGNSQFDNPLIDVIFTFADGTEIPNNGRFSFIPSGNIIDGWQRIFGEFTVPSNAQFMTVKLNYTDQGPNVNTVLYDDFRIHPSDGNMVSFVFNPYNLRLMATLDENNYATFLIRDEEGVVIKTNVETEKGILTINEGTSHVAQ